MHKTFSTMRGFKTFQFDFDGGGSGEISGDGFISSFVTVDNKDYTLHEDDYNNNCYSPRNFTTFYEFDFREI
jgi:hypothetical protein